MGGSRARAEVLTTTEGNDTACCVVLSPDRILLHASTVLRAPSFNATDVDSQ